MYTFFFGLHFVKPFLRLNRLRWVRWSSSIFFSIFFFFDTKIGLLLHNHQEKAFNCHPYVIIFLGTLQKYLEFRRIFMKFYKYHRKGNSSGYLSQETYRIHLKHIFTHICLCQCFFSKFLDCHISRVHF